MKGGGCVDMLSGFGVVSAWQLSAGSDPPAQPEPYAREAKFMSETKVLGRDVRVMLEGVDNRGKLFGQVPPCPLATLTLPTFLLKHWRVRP